MIMNIRSVPSIILFAAFAAAFFCPHSNVLGFLDLKKFDPPPPKRDKYLAFSSPPSLRYAPVPLEADRLTLIRLEIPKEKPPAKPVEETNASDEPEFPVVTYSTEPQAPSGFPPPVISVSPPPSKLPLADPFEGVVDSDVGSTDELLDVFDQLRIDSRAVRMNAIPFIPPYTVAPDNLKIGTKATYRRVPR